MNQPFALGPNLDRQLQLDAQTHFRRQLVLMCVSQAYRPGLEGGEGNKKEKDSRGEGSEKETMVSTQSITMKEPLGMEEDMEMDDFALTAPSAG